MEEVYKEIKLCDGNEMRLQISNAYCGRSIRLEKDYIVDDRLINGFTLCQWDDYAFDVFIDNADYVSEICCLKHPYQNGVTARKGIEY